MLILSRKEGRLANRIILFAHFIANARSNNYTILNPSFEEYMEYFSVTSGNICSTYPAKTEKNKHAGHEAKRSRTKSMKISTTSHTISYIVGRSQNFRDRIIRSTNFIFKKILYTTIYNSIRIIAYIGFTSSKYHAVINNDDEEFNLNNPNLQKLIKEKKFVFIRGWLNRDFENVERYSTEIRDYFRPQKKFQETVDNFINNIRGQGDILIGIHIRRGDYKLFRGGLFFYKNEIYKRFMQSIVEEYPQKDVQFMICSDESLNYDDFSGFSITFGLNHELLDLYSLAQCDYILGPPSTYTMWASYYGRVPLFMISDPKSDVSMQNFSIKTL